MGISQVVAFQRITASMINQLPVVVSYLATGSVSNSNAETIIGTFTIPAGDPTFPGGYQYFAFLSGAESGGPTIVVRMRLNSVTGTQVGGHTTAVTFSASPANYELHGQLSIESIGASGTFAAVGYGGQTVIAGGAAPFGPFVVDGAAINTTVSNTLVITAQFGTASASNTMATKFGALYRL